MIAPASPGPALSPAILIAGAHSGCGKTTAALALMAAFSRRGLRVQAFKAGPDFIDPGHHARITGRPSFNLDLWMHGEAGQAPGTPSPSLALARQYALEFAAPLPAPDVRIIEGAMGLFDGAESASSCADVAEALGVPALLVIDARGMGATAAAVAKGLASFRPSLPPLGAICSFVGSERHASLLREAFHDFAPEIPLFGCLPRAEALAMPSRHLGLVSAGEALTPERIRALADHAERYLDLDGLLRAARDFAGGSVASPLTTYPARPEPTPVRLALARDEAFSFWYPEHDTLLEAAGAEIVPFSPLRDSGLPDGAQGLILPGGYPELHAGRLSANVSMREAVRRFAQEHPVYGECGGFLYLMDALETDAPQKGARLPMCGCLPLTARMETSRAALGYREVTGRAGPWQGLALRGHEFHYSRIMERPASLPALWDCASPARPSAGPEAEGAALGRVCGSYVHVSFLSQASAAPRFVQACRERASLPTLGPHYSGPQHPGIEEISA